MADKEERIYIFTQKKACDICKKSLEEYDGLQPDCSNCPFGGDENYPYVTLQEAIEKMAKAIFSKSGFPKDCIWEEINEETKTAFRLYAREALNTLLGVERR